MKRLKILIIVLVLSMSIAVAQESYFGLSTSIIISPVGAIPLPGIQFGTEISDNLEFRVSFESLLVVSLLSADILFIEELPDETARYYFGGGPDILLLATPWLSGALPMGLHATGGYEYLFDNIGIFSELQPLITFGGIAVKAKAGLNIHF